MRCIGFSSCLSVPLRIGLRESLPVDMGSALGEIPWWESLGNPSAVIYFDISASFLSVRGLAFAEPDRRFRERFIIIFILPVRRRKPRGNALCT